MYFISLAFVNQLVSSTVDEIQKNKQPMGNMYICVRAYV